MAANSFIARGSAAQVIEKRLLLAPLFPPVIAAVLPMRRERVITLR
jgi:hypothetical protein